MLVTDNMGRSYIDSMMMTPRINKIISEINVAKVTSEGDMEITPLANLCRSGSAAGDVRCEQALGDRVGEAGRRGGEDTVMPQG